MPATASAAFALLAMLELERARNLLALGERDEVIVAMLDSADNTLRALIAPST